MWGVVVALFCGFGVCPMCADRAAGVHEVSRRRAEEDHIRREERSESTTHRYKSHTTHCTQPRILIPSPPPQTFTQSPPPPCLTHPPSEQHTRNHTSHHTFRSTLPPHSQPPPPLGTPRILHPRTPHHTAYKSSEHLTHSCLCGPCTGFCPRSCMTPFSFVMW